jgi:hypothetical protein
MTDDVFSQQGVQTQIMFPVKHLGEIKMLIC